MNRLVVAIFVAACAFLGTGHAQDHGPNDGNRLLTGCGELVQMLDSGTRLDLDVPVGAGFCLGYLGAVQDILNVKNWPASESACLPEGTSTIQLGRIVVKWLRAHPEKLHENAFLLSLNILHETFPCRAQAKTKKSR